MSTRKVYDINEFIDIMSSIKNGCFATVCYLSSAKVKKTLRGVDTDAFGSDLDANRTDGDEEYYNTLKQYQSGSIKKFPYNGVVKMSKIQFHWQSEEKYGENYGKYADARDALITKYGGVPARKDSTDAKQAYGNGSVSIGSTDNTQGKLYSHQNGATIQNRTTEYFLVDTNGKLKGGISKNAIQKIVAKSGDADGVSALRKVNATDEQIASYLEELKKLKFHVLKLMYDSILFVVASVNGEKIFFWNSKLAQQVGSGSYVVQIDPQSFMEKAKELYSKAYVELRESIKRYNKLLKENKRIYKKQLTESQLHNIIRKSVNKILEDYQLSLSNQGKEGFNNMMNVVKAQNELKTNGEVILHILIGNYETIDVSIRKENGGYMCYAKGFEKLCATPSDAMNTAMNYARDIAK